ncbi:hypothetical protein CWI38_0473p0040 [Hamiltosporidium tvaerminnensis]|uniref:Uncharacterized protein n=1 Tax=Hamiltosporidium tvaerminnensis TaxID=1176355 RepID=A0A4Q9LZW4_9MICR|nr:hypothetical protein CWI38_0473p0040 [Hamiltosporidium tvaerminnensis]
MGFKTNDNHIENLIMDFYNEKLLEFNFLQISKYEYINILIFKNIKRLVLEEIKIIEKNENVRFTYRNNSIMILEVIYPEISSKSIIYDYIDMLDELKNLRLQFENKLAKNYILSQFKNRNKKMLINFLFSDHSISKYDILELSFLTEVDCKFNQIESLTFKYCIFSTPDKESIRCKNLEYIKFHRCKFDNINFSNLFCKDIRYKIKKFYMNESQLTDKDLIWLCSLRCLVYMSFFDSIIPYNALLKFKKSDFANPTNLKLNLFQYKNRSKYKNHIYEEFGLIDR